MAYEVFLPTNKKQREIVLNSLVAAGEKARHIPEVGWWLCHHYLQGAREFTELNYQRGIVEVSYQDEQGDLQFRFDDIVSKFQAQVGRLLQIDIAPRIQRRGIGLEGLRKASIAQVVLDSAFPAAKVEELKLNLFAPLTKYGALGLAVWNEGEDVGIDVVMPWEVVPIPPTPTENRDVRGIARVRWVPIDWVKSLSNTPDAKATVWEEVDVTSAPVGYIPTESGSRFSTFISSSETTEGAYTGKGTTARGAKKGEDKTHVDVVKFVEVWIETSLGYLAQYDVMAGGKILYSLDYRKAGNKIYMPIQMCNDINTGGFWGRSFVSVLLPMNIEMENTIGRQLQNVQDTDAYGLLCEPTTLGMPAQIMRGSDGIKRVRFEPDYTVPDLKPFNIAPFNSGTLPIEVIKVGMALMDKLANQPTELMRGDAPGRTDSQSALGFLFEVSNTPLTPTASSVAKAVSNCYRAMLNILKIQWTSARTVEVSLLDDSLAGIALEPSTGAMSLAENSIPHPDEVNVSVRAMLPKSKEQEKMELLTALDKGIIDMFEYRILARKKGLEIPVGSDVEWENYRRAMMENIILFGDGTKPGEVIFNILDLHLVHLRVMQPFMARPEYYQTDPAVRNAFVKHYIAHLEQTGTMPDQAPYPEEAATEEDIMQKMAQQMGGPSIGAPAEQTEQITE